MSVALTRKLRSILQGIFLLSHPVCRILVPGAATVVEKMIFVFVISSFG